LLDLEGLRRRLGFEVSRFVDASDEADARALALEAVMSTPQYRAALRNADSAGPICTVSEVIQLTSTEVVPSRQPGFAFYPEDGT
jgi:hypothetical protein